MELINTPKLNELPEDEIYLLMGQELFKDEKSFTLLTSKQIIERAKVWFNMNMPRFQSRICTNDAIRQLYEKQEAANITTALIDLIAGALTGIAPATAAYLLYRKGINLLCKTHWALK